MRHTFAIGTLFVAFLASTAAADRTSTISSYGQCKRSGNDAACKRCLQSGNFYNFDRAKKRWVCGATSDMKPAKIVAAKPPPKKPALGKTFTTYATIQPGTVQLGSPETESGRDDNEKRSTVKVSRAFLMKTTEVTQGEWYNVMGTLHHSYDEKCGMDCPVVSVPWPHAIEYLNKLSAREKLEECYDTSTDPATWTKGLACKGYRLPTEAEWVLAARGGTNDARHGEVDDIAWYSGNSDGVVHPVGKKQANAFGLHDMLGNVREHVYDAWDYKTSPQGAVDPIRHELGEGGMTGDRTMCGGSYDDGDRRARAAARQAFPAGSGSAQGGFRPVRTK